MCGINAIPVMRFGKITGPEKYALISLMYQQPLNHGGFLNEKDADRP